MRIAFILRHALYLRNFESALRGLADRGHEVLIVLAPLDKQVDTTLLTALTSEYPNIRECPIGPRTSWWWPVSDGVRGVRDFLRYLEPDYADAPALVARGGRRLPRSVLWAFDNIPGLRSVPVRRSLARLARIFDEAVPPDPGAIKALRRWAPDLLLVTPMIDFTYGQTDYVKAARHLGLPSVLAVASWDNLTNKGLIQVVSGSRAPVERPSGARGGRHAWRSGRTHPPDRGATLRPLVRDEAEPYASRVLRSRRRDRSEQADHPLFVLIVVHLPGRGRFRARVARRHAEVGQGLA